MADRLRRRKLPFIVCIVVATALNAAMALSTTSTGLVPLATALGFFFLPAFALLLTMTAEVVDAKDTAASTALVMLAGNAGGVAVVAIMGAIGDWSRGDWMFLCAVTVVAAVGSLAIPETSLRSNGSRQI